MRLETDRLVLRSLVPSDVEPEVSLWHDPDVMRFMGGPRDPGRVRSILREELDTPPPGPLGQWPVVDRLSGEFVGDCGLIAKEIDGRSEVELVYLFTVSAWGNGYATEIGSALLRFGLGDLGLPRIVSLIDPGNVASKRVASKLGMVCEAMVTRPDGGVRELWTTGSGD
jgi:RimJ/RimL family protein N-acetyltransferase